MFSRASTYLRRNEGYCGFAVRERGDRGQAARPTRGRGFRRAIRFDGLKQRTLFVVLVLHAPEPVSADALLEALWGNDQPSGAMQALQKQRSPSSATCGSIT